MAITRRSQSRVDYLRSPRNNRHVSKALALFRLYFGAYFLPVPVPRIFRMARGSRNGEQWNLLAVL